jgi:hypothetical protein
MALCRVLGHKSEEVTGGWRKLLNEHHTNLYSTRNDVRVIKSKMRRRCCSWYIRSDGTTYVYINLLWRAEKGAADGKGGKYSKRGHFKSGGL